MKALEILKEHKYSLDCLVRTDVVSHLLKQTNEAIAELEALENRSCNWYQEENNDYFESDCGAQFTLFEGMPSENNMNFCHKCGKKLIEHKYVVD